uniref:Nucleoside diphosphate-linked moiety X motif 6 n=1 Tax=Odontella aurita TaxID=265563 RepID=A0A7S4IJP3_9STRA
MSKIGSEANGSSSTLATPAKGEEEEAEERLAVSFPEESLHYDTYNGVTIDAGKLPDELSGCPDAFVMALGESLEKWSEEGRRGIWIRMTTDHSKLIPSITDLGFDFQHAEPGKVTLTKWLPSEEESRLPHGPTHQIGVGTLVLHPRSGKMLAVQEKTGPAAARKLWKMPTGLTDPGEDIADAAVRELKEETGLDCVFDRIICFRQAHSGGHLRHSDMFFVCLLRLHPKYEEGLDRGEEVPLFPQEEEIAEAAWIDMERYADQDVWRASPLYKEMNGAMIDAARGGIEYSDRASEVGSADDDTAGGVVESVQINGKTVPTSALGVRSGGFVARTLPVGYRPGTNTIYISKL